MVQWLDSTPGCRGPDGTALNLRSQQIQQLLVRAQLLDQIDRQICHVPQYGIECNSVSIPGLSGAGLTDGLEQDFGPTVVLSKFSRK